MELHSCSLYIVRKVMMFNILMGIMFVNIIQITLSKTLYSIFTSHYLLVIHLDYTFRVHILISNSLNLNISPCCHTPFLYAFCYCLFIVLY